MKKIILILFIINIITGCNCDCKKRSGHIFEVWQDKQKVDEFCSSSNFTDFYIHTVFFKKTNTPCETECE